MNYQSGSCRICWTCSSTFVYAVCIITTHTASYIVMYTYKYIANICMHVHLCAAVATVCIICCVYAFVIVIWMFQDVLPYDMTIWLYLMLLSIPYHFFQTSFSHHYWQKWHNNIIYERVTTKLWTTDSHSHAVIMILPPTV